MARRLDSRAAKNLCYFDGFLPQAPPHSLRWTIKIKRVSATVKGNYTLFFKGASCCAFPLSEGDFVWYLHSTLLMILLANGGKYFYLDL